MNKLINEIKKENSIYILAAVVHSCDNAGYLNTNTEEHKIIISSYLIDLIDKGAKTPENTMNTTIFHQGGKKYFDVIEKQFVSLKDKSDLPLLKQEAIHRLNSKKCKKFTNP